MASHDMATAFSQIFARLADPTFLATLLAPTRIATMADLRLSNSMGEDDSTLSRVLDNPNYLMPGLQPRVADAILNTNPNFGDSSTSNKAPLLTPAAISGNKSSSTLPPSGIDSAILGFTDSQFPPLPPAANLSARSGHVLVLSGIQSTTNGAATITGIPAWNRPPNPPISDVAA